MIKNTRLVKAFVWTTILIGLVACGESPIQKTSIVATIPISTEKIVTAISANPGEPTPTTDVPNEAPAQTALPPVIIEQPTMQGNTAVVVPIPTGKILPALIQVEKPGEASLIASPLQVLANVYPGEGGRVTVQLYGEDGRLMADELITLKVPDSGWVELATSIPFDITDAGEAALLVISTRDGFDRRIAQVGIPVLLLQLGRSEIELPIFQKDPYTLTYPAYGSEIKGGEVRIEGFAHFANANPIVGELVTETGGIMKTIVVYPSDEDLLQEYVPFSMVIPYKVEKRTAVRLTLRQADKRLGAVDIALKSLIIYLYP